MPTEVGRGLPIAETFHSIQGEGTYVGAPMHFVRLAGCPVGKKASNDVLETSVDIPQHLSACQTWDGRFFPCDTDFSCHTYKTVDELIGETWEKHICLTGGEPLIHQKSLIEQGFFQQAFQKGIQIHIETSGTIALNEYLVHDNRFWITVAPKWQYRDELLIRANEIKFLVDENFDISKLQDVRWHINTQIYLSPINEEKTINQENVQRCLEILKDHPTWRLSCQWHKFLNLR